MAIMKKIFIKYKILVNGFNPIGEYFVDGFSLKKGHLDESYFDKNHTVTKDGMEIDMNLYFISCLVDYEKLIYRYLENDDYIKFEIPDKMEIKKSNFKELLNSNNDIIERVYNLEQKLRIEFNIPLIFQIIHIEFFNVDKKFLFYAQQNNPISDWNRLTYNLDPNEFSNNSRFHINIKSMKEVDNKYFKRALELYNDSFESDKLSNRYILIFSSLEAIFNLDSKEVTEKISKFSAKLLAENKPDLYNQIYNDIRRLYKKRCDYVHGAKINNISDNDEKLLRKYLRKIIIAYWIIIMNTKKTSKQILKYLDSNEKLEVQIRMVITALNSNDFSSQQKNLLNILEKEYNIVFPSELKKKIIDTCEKY